jgi:hypothetical protein
MGVFCTAVLEVIDMVNFLPLLLARLEVPVHRHHECRQQTDDE